MPSATARMKLVQIADGIVSLLASDPDATLRLTVEITADFASGVRDAIRRGVKEDATSLGFSRRRALDANLRGVIAPDVTPASRGGGGRDLRRDADAVPRLAPRWPHSRSPARSPVPSHEERVDGRPRGTRAGIDRDRSPNPPREVGPHTKPFSRHPSHSPFRFDRPVPSQCRQSSHSWGEGALMNRHTIFQAW